MSATQRFLFARTVEPIFDPSCAVETKSYFWGIISTQMGPNNDATLTVL